MTRRSAVLVTGGLTIAILAISIPGALRDTAERGGLYILSPAFLEDIPKRLAGPGRLRFLFQPAMAILLGIRGGREDARLGHPPFLAVLAGRGGFRAGAMSSALENLSVLLLMGILLDSVFQWVLLGVSHPGPALVVGPVLITIPYAIARTLAGAVSRRPPEAGRGG